VCLPGPGIVWCPSSASRLERGTPRPAADGSYGDGDWYKEFCFEIRRRAGQNPSTGNKGGRPFEYTIKSLGAIVKARPRHVSRIAATRGSLARRGLNLMQARCSGSTPGLRGRATARASLRPATERTIGNDRPASSSPLTSVFERSLTTSTFLLVT